MSELSDQIAEIAKAQNKAIMSGIELGRKESTARIKELERDIMILVGRLYGEDKDTFAPETRGVMEKWGGKFEEILNSGGHT